MGVDCQELHVLKINHHHGMMTSFIINSHLNRPPAPSWKITGFESDCPFCRIIKGELQAYRVLENDKVLAILGMVGY